MEVITPASNSTHLTKRKEECCNSLQIGQSHRFNTRATNFLGASTGRLECGSYVGLEHCHSDPSDQKVVSTVVELHSHSNSINRSLRQDAETVALVPANPVNNSIVQRAENAVETLVRIIARHAAAEFFGSGTHGSKAREVAA